jgi:hypothetical protein
MNFLDSVAAFILAPFFKMAIVVDPTVRGLRKKLGIEMKKEIPDPFRVKNLTDQLVDHVKNRYGMDLLSFDRDVEEILRKA